MNKNNANIVLLKPLERTSDNVQAMVRTIYLIATGQLTAPVQRCERTYDALIAENINIFDSNYHFDWYIFPCHCETAKCLNFDPLENKNDAKFFLQLCRCLKNGSKYSKEQIGKAPDIRMAICKKAIDQWFDSQRNETYRIRLLKIFQHLDYTLRSLMILKAPEAYQYFEFVLREICLPYFKDISNDRYQELYTYDINFHQSIAFLGYLSTKYASIKQLSESKISDEKEILLEVYQNIMSNISDGENNLKKNVFCIKKNSDNGKYVLDIADSEAKNYKSVENSEKKINVNEQKDSEAKYTKTEKINNNPNVENSEKHKIKFMNIKINSVSTCTDHKNNENCIQDSDSEKKQQVQQVIKKTRHKNGDIKRQINHKKSLDKSKFLAGIIIVIAISWSIIKILIFPELNILFAIIPTLLLIAGSILSLVFMNCHPKNKSHEKIASIGQQSDLTNLSNILEQVKNQPEKENQNSSKNDHNVFDNKQH